ncbi:No apical meristem-associated, C-terminal domain [Sesbania bispinosa]|nr:No apical meristem-associated, C-terminal domain [Sesbania bispinosa]
MRDAHAIYFQDKKLRFEFENAWDILRKQPKWLAQFEESSKRTKVSASGEYSSSSNADTPSSYEPTSPTMDRPIGTKAAKRIAKEKSSNVVDLTGMEEVLKTKTKALEDMVRAKHERNRLREEEIKLKNKELDMQLLYKDTASMSDAQLHIHQKLCKNIEKNMDFSK